MEGEGVVVASQTEDCSNLTLFASQVATQSWTGATFLDSPCLDRTAPDLAGHPNLTDAAQEK